MEITFPRIAGAFLRQRSQRSRRCAGGNAGWLLAVILTLAPLAAVAQAPGPDPADQVCQRFAPGSALQAPGDLRSQNGVLEVTLKIVSVVDAQGLTRYCYLSDSGLESPTLHVYPGDQLIIHFQNALPASPAPPPMASMQAHRHVASDSPNNDCSGGAMSPAVSNLHFHGLNVAPTCHQDEVINTLVQPAGTFDYNVQIPPDEPTGLYWYHPHPHGFSTGQVLGGAAGALIVEGIENVATAVAGLPQRVFVFRDQLPAGIRSPHNPPLDVSVNYAPVPAPAYPTPVVQTAPGVSEFWRALNASSNTMLQLQYLVEGVAQPLQLVAIDGVPIGQGTGAIQSLVQTSILLPAGARAEFIAITPKAGQQAQLITQAIDTGSAGLPHPQRPLVSIVAQNGTVPAVARLAGVRTSVRVTRFANLSSVPADGRRLLYFSEGPGAAYFITVQGQTPAVFEMGAPPAITLHQGTTEEWTVENRSLEDHVFHIHQMRFQVVAINGQEVSDPALRDTFTIPHWSGTGAYPSARMRMDFRAANIVGEFVYHCHLLSHEDFGMMAAIQVLPSGIATTTTLEASASETGPNTAVLFTATVAAASGGTAASGTVQFFDGDQPLGAPSPLSNGKATLSAALTGFGAHVISAAYSGDATRNQSLSAGTTIKTEDFALSATALTVPRGHSGSSQVTVTTSDGFSSVMNFTCSLPASLASASCTLTPNTLAGPGMLTLSINTQAPAASALLTRASGVALAGLLLLAPWGLRRRMMFAVAVLGTLFVIIGCSSSHPASGGAPPGSYSVALSGTCGGDAAPIVHTVSVPLTIT
jgi:FtsP/CotA-like multicopper oxidase with cupredoxin domain